jgi:hypothetical protein
MVDFKDPCLRYLDVYRLSLMIDCKTVVKIRLKLTVCVVTWKGIFKILSFSVMLLKFFTNLNLSDSNKVNAPEVLHI